MQDMHSGNALAKQMPDSGPTFGFTQIYLPILEQPLPDGHASLGLPLALDSDAHQVRSRVCALLDLSREDAQNEG